MWFECGECGHRLMRERPPAVCGECGMAGATFVRIAPDRDGDVDEGSARGDWLRAGIEAGVFRTCMDGAWAHGGS